MNIIPKKEKNALYGDTGIIWGMNITPNISGTDFDISEGVYRVLGKEKYFPGVTGEAIGADPRSIVMIDGFGDLQIVSNFFEYMLSSNYYAPIGVVSHPLGVVLGGRSFQYFINGLNKSDLAQQMCQIGNIVKNDLFVQHIDTTLTMEVYDGKINLYNGLPLSITGSNPVTFVPIHVHPSNFEWVYLTPTTAINVTQYDNAGTLTAMPASSWRQDILFYSVFEDVYYLVIGQETFTDQSDITDQIGYDLLIGSNASEEYLLNPEFGAVALARIQVQQGATEIGGIKDSRRTIGLPFIIAGFTQVTQPPIPTGSGGSSENGPFSFNFYELTPSQTDVVIYGESGVAEETVITKNSYITSISVQSSAPITAGTIDIVPSINGTKVIGSSALNLQLNSSDDVQDSATIASGDVNYQITADQTIGAVVTTSAGLLPANVDITVNIFTTSA